MNRTLPRWTATAAAAAALLLASGPVASAAPTVLDDSTRVEQWTLANGLRVATRHVPGASSVAITLAFGTGTAADPPGREGLARLLAETWFTAAAGEIPERTHAEMASLRPLGWTVKALPRVSLFVEVASVQQFPGVLHQTAVRMRGVRVTAKEARAALASAREDLSAATVNPDGLAWLLLRAIAAGADSATLRRIVEGGTLAAVAPRDLERLLRERFVPANAVLSLAGDLGEVGLHPLIEREFGGLAAGPAPARSPDTLRPAVATWALPGLSGPAGVLGVIAPAITDSLHPEFFLSMLVIGSRAREVWGDPAPPFTHRFTYSLFEDPDLVRFFPPMDAEQGDTTWLAARLEEILVPMSRADVSAETFDGLKRGVSWMLGGPMAENLAPRARTDVGLIANLSTSAAMRELWQPESFWADYRRRFDSIATVPIGPWCRYALDPEREVRLALTARGSR